MIKGLLMSLGWVVLMIIYGKDYKVRVDSGENMMGRFILCDFGIAIWIMAIAISTTGSELGIILAVLSFPSVILVLAVLYRSAHANQEEARTANDSQAESTRQMPKVSAVSGVAETASQDKGNHLIQHLEAGEKLEEEKAAIRFCRFCGYELLPGSAFCSACGKVVGGNVCPKCQTELASDACFCHKCGHSLKA